MSREDTEIVLKTKNGECDECSRPSCSVPPVSRLVVVVVAVYAAGDGPKALSIDETKHKPDAKKVCGKTWRRA
jgi:hypothetical protein